MLQIPEVIIQFESGDNVHVENFAWGYGRESAVKVIYHLEVCSTVEQGTLIKVFPQETSWTMLRTLFVHRVLW